MLSPTPLDSQPSYGVIDSAPIPKLVLKLRKRKKCSARNAHGSPFLTQGLCDESDIDVPGSPIVAVSAANASAGRTDPCVCRSRYRSNHYGVSDKAGIPDANRCVPSSFRRGLSGDMLDSGSTLCHIIVAAGWIAAGYRPYILLIQNNEGGLSIL